MDSPRRKKWGVRGGIPTMKMAARRKATKKGPKAWRRKNLLQFRRRQELRQSQKEGPQSVDGKTGSMQKKRKAADNQLTKIPWLKMSNDTYPSFSIIFFYSWFFAKPSLIQFFVYFCLTKTYKIVLFHSGVSGTYAVGYIKCGETLLQHSHGIYTKRRRGRQLRRKNSYCKLRA